MRRRRRGLILGRVEDDDDDDDGDLLREMEVCSRQVRPSAELGCR